ncbi:PAS domain-containing hybrid sensor histidine kinase/response regulator [Marinomonas sp. MED121]|uniref:hybrid sensor histidine kinase/response regulator n=1 Tax=Marinomonas sp. MED121 TaxID=314277 RepID=UPI0002DB6E61|nr:PAS domain-containing hybrid sensor histidine kinase/response regulator [Marinomonas sp. MED121]
MTPFWILLAVAYILGLFWIARWGDKENPKIKKLTRHPLVYSLSLAIYCTAWTFYGAVGEATRFGWSYLPILLGPVLLYLLAFPFLKKLTFVSHKQNITSIADFISSRYGKRPLTAPLVIMIAMLAIIPYISLQLKAIGSNFSLFVNQEGVSSSAIVLIATISVGIFAVIFGTRKIEVTEYRSGMMLAIAVESLFKLFAIIGVGFIAIFLLNKDESFSLVGTFQQTFESPIWQTEDFFSFSFIMQTLMAAAAVICLPRQFHVTVVDHQEKKQLNMARWVFPLYLAIFAILIPPIAMSGQNLFGIDTNADTYVIQFALASNSPFLEILIFLGGLSATTAMIIIATFSLSIMISNDVILPIMLARASSRDQAQPLYHKKILRIRRFVIAAILILSYLYYQEMANSEPLAGTGLLAFSLVLQLVPAVIGGLYWRRGHAIGVYTGFILGFVFWLLWLIFPLLGTQDWSNHNFETRAEVISLGACISLIANILGYIAGSLLARERLLDRIQATAFVSPTAELEGRFIKPKSSAQNGDLIVLLETFLGKQRCQQILAEYQEQHQLEILEKDSPDRLFIDFCERILGGVFGGSSARTIINSVMVGKRMKVEEMVTYLDEATQAIQFNQNLLFVSMENLAQGISVIDKDLRLVAWNKTYAELYYYPDDLLKVGVPIESLIRFNANNGECGFGDVENLVQKRLTHLRNATKHRFLRRRANGRVIEMLGNPLPEGGFVTSFTDVTEHIESQHALKEANIDLQNRIQARSDEVKSVNQELIQEINRRAKAELELIKAKAEAEKANHTKTEFLALASHDILQPLNAARLYLGALEAATLEDSSQDILDKLNASVQSTETLISTLLEIARFDQGAIKPVLVDIKLNELLLPIINEFSVIAQEKQLDLISRIGNHRVHSDSLYLRRIIQNFVSNAVKYTQTGKVLIACRKRQDHLLIQVWDTGVGIPKQEQDLIFDDFYRWQNTNEEGLGLGLGLVKRMQTLLGLSSEVQSKVNKGSCFGIRVPLAKEAHLIETSQPVSEKQLLENDHQLLAWCIDDDPNNLDAMQSLLERWQHKAHCFTKIDEVLSQEQQPDLLLVDFQLGQSLDGLALIETIRDKFESRIPAVLITAVRDPNLIQQCEQTDVLYLSKPVKPAKLRSILRSIK